MKLYPQIQIHLAEEAITDLLSNIRDEELNNTEAVQEFFKLSFNESYVTYKDKSI